MSEKPEEKPSVKRSFEPEIADADKHPYLEGLKVHVRVRTVKYVLHTDLFATSHSPDLHLANDPGVSRSYLLRRRDCNKRDGNVNLASCGSCVVSWENCRTIQARYAGKPVLVGYSESHMHRAGISAV